MNTHPWIGLGATVSRHDLPATHGIIVTVAVDWLGMMSDDGVFVNGAFHSLTFDNPAEARRRIEAAGAPVDYEAIGRGIANAILNHAGPYPMDRTMVLRRACEAIGRGIGSARGGAS